MASTDSPKSNSEGELDSAPNSSKAVSPSSSLTPTVCLILFAANSACGAFIGSIFGYGAGLVKKKGFKGSFVEARSNAKSFAILSGVESLVVCILARLRRKDDAINAGIAGCCTGLALSFPGIIFIFKTIGAPKDLLQSCLAIGALSFMVEGLNKRQQSLAHPISRKTSMHNNTSPPLALPLQFPLPDEMKGPFSDFYNSLIKCNKRTFPTSR